MFSVNSRIVNGRSKAQVLLYMSSTPKVAELVLLQVIVEKAESGNTDHIKHALDLFVDFVAIFVRILVIMLQNAERREEKSDSRRRRR